MPQVSEAPGEKVSVVVVTYDSAEWIERCLASVAGLETVVVDNGSRDGTVDLVRSRFPDARVIERENDGLAAGWNAGIAATDKPYVLLLNSDAWLEEGAAARLLASGGPPPRGA